jgi:hypothetical protein
MYLQSLGEVVVASFQQTLFVVAAYIPRLVAAIIVFLIGWLVAVLVGKAVDQIIKALRVDSALERLDVHRALDRAGIRLNSGAFVGGLVKWFLIVVFLLAAINILDLGDVSAFLEQVLLYIPHVVVAALILVIAGLVAQTVERTARASVEAAGLHGGLVGAVARWSIWIFAIVAALLQLGIAETLIQTLVTGVVAMIALAGGLAFGLGGKDIAGDILGKARREISNRG